MFDQLSDRLQSTLSDVRSRGKLNEGDIDSAMRDIRLALLEADVNFKVVKAFTKTLKERCLGAEVMDSLDPGQQVVKIVKEELADLMGGTGAELAMASSGPTVILMAGLQGSGKTTACAKLAQYFKNQRKDVALAACDESKLPEDASTGPRPQIPKPTSALIPTVNVATCMRGPTTLPASIARFSATSMYSPAPTSRMVVKPASSVRRA